MKNFFLQIILFSILMAISIIWVFSNVDGADDQYYLRFTSPKQSSLILGVSKAAQGLQPNVFNEILKRDDMFNYSFNAFISPYGETYFNSIKRKLNQNTRNGIFIITIDAWSLGSQTKEPNDSTNFRELPLCLSNSFVTLNPNVPYLIKFFEHKYLDIFRKPQKTTFLHQDGWLEVTVGIDSLARKIRLERSIAHYNEMYMPFWKYSSLRLNYLGKIIKFLKKHGSVYIVRLPEHEKLHELENLISPDLDEKIGELSSYYNISYLNFSDSNKDFIYTDGIHLWKESGAEVSKIIASWILQDQNKSGVIPQ